MQKYGILILYVGQYLQHKWSSTLSSHFQGSLLNFTVKSHLKPINYRDRVYMHPSVPLVSCRVGLLEPNFDINTLKSKSRLATCNQKVALLIWL